MAKKASAAGSGNTERRKQSRRGSAEGGGSARPAGRALTRTTPAGSGDSGTAGEAFIKLLQSPLVADLLAVAATAALAALAEHGFSSRGAGDRRRAGRAVKEAGKAAAAAIGRRLSTEIEEIRKVSGRSKAAESA
jgi:hypothetical protein